MTLLKPVVLVLLMVAMFAGGWLVAKAGIGTAVSPSSLSDRERRFTERMSNSSLVGVFTVAGREDRSGTPDRYDFSGVDKLSDGRWRFNVRMRHSGVDVTVPVAVPLQWLGDLPMIVITDYAIPAMGTFSASVMFDGDQYAGTWSNPKVGGHMFGRIEKQKP